MMQIDKLDKTIKFVKFSIKMSTFKFSDVEVKSLEKFESTDLKNGLAGKKFYDQANDKIIMTSQPTPNSCQPSLNNGLLGTIYKAYSQHVPLRLRPDDIWLSILFNF